MEAPPRAGGYVPGFLTGGFTLLTGVLLPAFTIGYELITKLCAKSLFDPMPTLAHLAVITAVPALNLKLWLLREREEPLARGWWLAAAAAMAVSFSYTLIFLPLYPVAFIGIIYFGLGLLPFAPMSAGITTLFLMRKLRARNERPVARLVWSGLLAGVLVLMALDAPMAITRHAIHGVQSADEKSRARAVDLMRRFGSRDLLLRYSYDRSGFSTGLLGLILERSYRGGHSVAAARELYYRVTGDTHDSVPPPWNSEAWRFADDFVWDADQGGAQVGRRLAGLELLASRIDASMDADDAVAYVEWTAEFSNRVEWGQREARLTLALPPGGVVSRATLWVEGVEREASFASRELTRAAYERVVQTRRDPLLVTTNGADQVLVQMFPVPPGGTAKIRIGITAPLELSGDDRATLVMPAIVDRNFSIGDSLRHAVWVEGEGREAAADEGFSEARPQDPLARRRAEFTDVELSTRRPRVSLMRNAKASSVASGAVMQTILREPREPAGSFFVLLDGSASAEPARTGLMAALDRIPVGARVGFSVASLSAATLPLAPWSPERREELVRMLAEQRFEGGEDNIGELAQALATLEGEPRATLLWVHGPQKYDFGQYQARLDQVLDRGTKLPELWLLPLAPGPNRVLDDPRLLTGARTLAWTGDAAADIGAAITSYFDVAPRWTIRRVKGSSAGLVTGSAHVEKLWALEQVEDLFASGPERREEAIALAAKHRLVTPVSGAVVLETDADYLRAGLTPPDSAAVPTIPEPETWAMLIIACLAFAWAWRQRRLSPA